MPSTEKGPSVGEAIADIPISHVTVVCESSRVHTDGMSQHMDRYRGETRLLHVIRSLKKWLMLAS